MWFWALRVLTDADPVLIMRVAISARWREHGYDGLAFVMTGSWDPQEFPNLIPNVLYPNQPSYTQI